MIRRVCAAAIVVGALVVAAPAARADVVPDVQAKEGACVVIRDLGLAYCASNPFPYVHDLIDGLPAK